jgi:Ca-activated chloride channel family protein
MEGLRLHAAKSALLALVDRLDPSDTLGVVAFDSSAHVVLPARPLADHGKLPAKAAIEAIHVGGMTDLSSGYLRALQEARGAAGPTGATIVLLSDGQANEGITDPVALKGLAEQARDTKITTSTIGIGLGYDEIVLAALTEGGAGNHAFAEQPDAAAAALASEVEGLLSKNVQAASLLIKPGTDIATISVLNDLPSQPVADGILVELGDFYADETRRLVLAFVVPGRSSLGLATIAELVFTYVELPGLVQHTVTLPVDVNVLPGDEAAGRVRKPEVEKERLLLAVQRSKKESEELLRRGDVDGARSALFAGASSLAASPMASDADVAAEGTWFADSMQLLEERDATYNLKRSMASRTSRTRGSRDTRRGGEL